MAQTTVGDVATPMTSYGARQLAIQSKSSQKQDKSKQYKAEIMPPGYGDNFS